jgi:hypothetical protein
MSVSKPFFVSLRSYASDKHSSLLCGRIEDEKKRNHNIDNRTEDNSINNDSQTEEYVDSQTNYEDQGKYSHVFSVIMPVTMSCNSHY